MKFQGREKRALAVLGAAAALLVLLALVLPGRGEPASVAVREPIPEAEKRLARLRRLAAGVPGKQELLKHVSAELAQREKGIIQADTGAQALAQLMELLRRVARAQGPPLEIKTAELGQIARLGDDYGEAQLSVTFECRIEELLNLLADLTKQPEIVATREIRVATSNSKEKTLNVRLTVSGVVARRLAPEKKGLASF
jgi:hypothetical protein